MHEREGVFFAQVCPMSSVSLVKPTWIACFMRAGNECIRPFQSNRTRATENDKIGGCHAGISRACTEYNAVRRRADCIVHFRRKYLKGLLSIPSDGRSARRPRVSRSMSPLAPAHRKEPSSFNAAPGAGLRARVALTTGNTRFNSGVVT